MRIQKYEGSGAWQEGGAKSKPRMRSYGTAYGKSQLVVRQGSNGKRRCATKSLARLCIASATCAERSYGNQPTQCCLAYASIVLNTLYSVKTGDFTNELHELGDQGVDSDCGDPWFAEEHSVESCATRPVFSESSREYLFVVLRFDALTSYTAYKTDVSLQPNAVIEHCASFTFLESTDLLVVVQNFVYCQVVNIGKNIRVRDMVTIMRPSDTHGYICPRWVPMMAIDNYLGRGYGVVPGSDAVLGLLTVGFSVSTGPFS